MCFTIITLSLLFPGSVEDSSWFFIVKPSTVPRGKTYKSRATSREHGPRGSFRTQPPAVRQMYSLCLPTSSWLLKLLLQVSKHQPWCFGVPCASRMVLYLQPQLSEMLRNGHLLSVCLAFSCCNDVTDSFQAFSMLGTETRWIKKSCGWQCMWKRCPESQHFNLVVDSDTGLEK